MKSSGAALFLAGLSLGACAFAWDDLDPRLAGGGGAGGQGAGTQGGGGATGGATSSSSSGAMGGGGTGGGMVDPCDACPGRCSDTFSETFATMPVDWTFNGDASYDATAMVAELVPASSMSAGTLFRNDPIVVDRFTAQFEFRISGGPMNMGGGGPTGMPGDGLAFVLQTDGPTALGDSGGGLGVATLPGFGVELDTFRNTNVVTCTEAPIDHVALVDLTPCGMSGSDNIATPIEESAPLPGSLHDELWHQIEIRFDEGMVTVELDGQGVLGPAMLPGFVSGRASYVGFGAGTGGAFNRHAVRNFTMQFAEPRCL